MEHEYRNLFAQYLAECRNNPEAAATMVLADVLETAIYSLYGDWKRTILHDQVTCLLMELNRDRDNSEIRFRLEQVKKELAELG